MSTKNELRNFHRAYLIVAIARNHKIDVCTASSRVDTRLARVDFYDLDIEKLDKIARQKHWRKAKAEELPEAAPLTL